METKKIVGLHAVAGARELDQDQSAEHLSVSGGPQRPPQDGPDELCVDVVGDLPRCMDMTTAEDVIRRIELYFDGGAVEFLRVHNNRRIVVSLPYS